MVLAYHAGRIAHTLIEGAAPRPFSAALSAADTMWRGVPIFFVISGYCIAASSDSAIRKRDASLTSLLAKRARRIFPPYWAALGVVAAVYLVTRGFDWMAPSTGLVGASRTPLQWLGNLTLTERWTFHLTGAAAPSFFLDPAWTLCFEEQFYLACGLLVVTIGRHFFVGALVLSVIVTLGLPWTFSAQSFADGFFFDGLWLTFAAGVLVFWARKSNSVRTQRVALALLVAVSVAGFGARLIMPNYGASFMTLYKASEFGVAGAFASVIMSLSHLDDRIAESKLSRPLMYCGGISYSLYLVHWPLLEWSMRAVCHRTGTSWKEVTLALAVGLTVSMIAAIAFNRFVERRFMSVRSAGLQARQRGGPDVGDRPDGLSGR